LPEDIKEKIEFPEFEHFGRINFVDRGESYRFDDFKFGTDDRLQPLKYYLKGNFTDDDGRIVGNVNLTAEAFAFWGYGGAENWKVHRVRWNPGDAAAWGRSFVKWSGTITIGNEIIEVKNVLGFGEFYRCKSRYYSKLREDALRKLSKVRVVAEYTSVTSGVYYLNRSINDVINILKDLNTDWIYLGWRYRLPAPESPYEKPGFFIKEQIEEASRRGYTFSQLKKAIDEIHRETTEILNMKLYEEEWRILLSKIKDYMGGDIVILVRLDLGFPYSPIHVFSQYLNKSQQREFLIYLDNFLKENGVLFSYPVFGLYMGPWRKNETKILSWRRICWVNVFGEENCGFSLYDSLAPEFQTYETIRELAQKRRGEQRE